MEFSVFQFEYLRLFCFFCCQVLCPIQQLVHIFPKHLFAADVSAQAFCVVLFVPCEIQLRVGLGFPNPTPESSDVISIILLGYGPLFPPLIRLFYVWIESGAPCLSIQVSYHFCLTTYVSGWTFLELGEGDLWVSTSSHGPLFSSWPYHMGFF